MVDWNAMRTEYIQGGVSYRGLAAKYGVPLKTIATRAKNEHWVDLKKQANNETATKTVMAVSEKNSEIKEGVYDAALDLLAAFRNCVASENKMTAARLKDYGSALKSIQAVLTNDPSELDIKEQEARIAALRAKSNVGSEDDDDTGVILLPPRREADDG